ncbi:(d)CMP kinase [Mycoplasma phocoenae]|uniref:Cytidylate kinase n=1 Tax=Mycoplasma phocoenae TaxID=754517 RepID=A0A858U4H2_9MOLU|nr:(d)CMP kinase [Mycoplasma phocoenae]QJG66979.1 (d)CMP kinase [Mycoplasma phocoenae]
MKKRINIAIDGPSGVGKSSVAQLLAKHFGYFFISSGSLYRLTALLALRNNIDTKNEEAVSKLWRFEDVKIDEKENWYFKEENVTKQLRLDEVSQEASNVAVHPKIRKRVVNFLQWYSKSYPGLIIDGRDATYKILPDAELKIFLWADANIRAQRRVEQNKELGLISDYDIVLKQIKERDEQDMNREKDPLICSEGSIKIDSSNLTIEQVYEVIKKLAQERIG